MKKIKTYIAAGMMAMMMTGCGGVRNLDMGHLTNAVGGLTQALTLSDADIAAYSQQAVAQMDAQAKIAPANNAYTKRLNKLTQGLTSVDGLPLNFKVYLTNEVNAFACPDGSVRVYSGIMDMMNDDELLGIIGHEIGHVAMHHSKNAMKSALMRGALGEALASASSTVAALNQSQLGQLTEAYLSSSYSRKQENEADDFGYDFLKGAGKNPWAMEMAFEKMLQLEQKAASSGNQDMIGSYLNSMFSDHPATTERIKRMTERCNKDGIAKPSAQTTTTSKTTTTKKSTKKK